MSRIVSVAIVACSALAPVFGQASFQGLGNVPGSQGQATAVSGDGSTAVGWGYSAPGEEAWRWKNGVITGLGDLRPGEKRSNAYGVSGDGSVVVGKGRGSGNILDEAFRWQNGTMTGLGSLSNNNYPSTAHGVSADGSVVVGFSGSDDGTQAFRWENGTMVGLGRLPGGCCGSVGRAVTPDGSVIVGGSNSDQGPQAFRWENGVMTGLGMLSPGDQSDAYAVSADGSVIVGNSSNLTAGTGGAFRWEGGLMTELLPGPEGIFSAAAYAVSGDGSIIVGRGYSASRSEASIWDAIHGTRSLRSLLVNRFGLDLSGWSLYEATGISADGLTIVGYGQNPVGYREGWIAHIPEPGTLFLFLLGTLGLLRRRSGRVG